MKTTLSGIAFTLFLAMAFCYIITPTSSSAEMTLKISHQFSTDDVRAKELQVFGDRIMQNTQGQIKFRYYPAQSLFKAQEQWDAMAKGAVDICYFPPIYAAGKVPQLEITNFPCLFSQISEGLKWARAPIGKKLDSLIEDRGIKNLVWGWFDGAIGCTDKQIVLPADLKGTKMRGAGKYFENMLREAGASIISMPSPELYHAYATRVLTSSVTSSGSYLSYKLYEQLKYMNLPVDRSIWFAAGNIMMSLKTWNKLSPEHQRVFLEAAAYIQNDWLPKELSALTAKLDAECRSANVEIHYMNESEFNVWQELAKKTSWKRFSEEVEGGQELIDLALEALQ